MAMEIHLLPKTDEAKEIVRNHGAWCRVLSHDPSHPTRIEHVRAPNEQRELDLSQFDYAVARHF